MIAQYDAQIVRLCADLALLCTQIAAIRRQTAVAC